MQPEGPVKQPGEEEKKEAEGPRVLGGPPRRAAGVQPAPGMYVYMYLYVFVNICMYLYVFVCICMYLYGMCLYVFVCICMYLYVAGVSGLAGVSERRGGI